MVRTWSVRALWAAFVLVAVGFVVNALLALVFDSWTVIAKDQWRIYSIYFLTEFPDNILASQNGHRPVVPGLFYLADLHWFGANNVSLTAVGGFFCFLTAFVLSAVVYRDRETSRHFKVLSVSLLWIWISWLGSIRVLGHGNESVHAYLVTASLAGAVWILSRVAGAASGDSLSWSSLVGLIVCCLIATFSFGPGMVTWPTVLITLIMLRVEWRKAALLGVVFLGAIATYLMVLPGHGNVQGAIAWDGVRSAWLACVWLAGPLVNALKAHGVGPGASLEVCAGLAAVAVVLVAVWSLRALVGGRRPGPSELAGLMLTMFAIGSAILVALGRSGQRAPLEFLLGNRYTVWTVLFWAGSLVLAGVLTTRAARYRRTVGAAWVVLLVLVLVLLLPSELSERGRHHRVKLQLREAALSLVVGVGWVPEWRALYKGEGRIGLVAEEFEAGGLGMFSWPIARLVGKPLEMQAEPDRRARGRLSVTAIPSTQGVAPVVGKRSSELQEAFRRQLSKPPGARLSGWALDDRSNRPPAYVVAVDSAGVVKGLGLFTRPIRRVQRRKTGLEVGTRAGLWGYLADYDPQEDYAFYAITEDGEVLSLTEGGKGRKGSTARKTRRKRRG